MTSTQLANYLRSNRKRLGLSQDEVAFLLGAHSGSKVSRYEKFAREPSLATALAFEAIFQKPASELFAGLYEEVSQEVAARAKALGYRTAYQKPTPENSDKRRTLTSIATGAKTASRQP